MKRIKLVLVLCIIFSNVIAQESNSSKIQLVNPSIEITAQFAVWRTDYYICTGIAYAKSLGNTEKDFTEFLGNTHSWEEIRDKGLEPAVSVLNFVIKNYKGGVFEILTETEDSVSMRSNRPYVTYFNDGPLLGTTLEEFEQCLWGHIAIMASRIDLDFKYKIEDGWIVSTLSKVK